jgi:hypothetical protein
LFLDPGQNLPKTLVLDNGQLDENLLRRTAGPYISGQYSNPIGIFCFNAYEGWSRDVSEDVAREVRGLLDLERRDVPSSLQDFLERHEGQGGIAPKP